MNHPDRGIGNKPVLSTIWAPDDPEWNDVVDVLPAGRLEPSDVTGFWRRSGGREAIILRGSVSFRQRYRDLVFALILRRRRAATRVVISDAIWEPRSRALDARAPWIGRMVPALARSVIGLLDGPHVIYGVLSTAEIETFSRTWGVPRQRVAFTGFCHTLWGGLAASPTTDGGYLFAGGESLRDYPLLATALRRLDAIPTTIATGWTPEQPVSGLTTGRVSHDEFVRLLANCRATVVPLGTSVRSAGQQTYLNAMRLGKAVIVTDAPGVRDYIQDTVTGFVVPPEPEALARMIAYVMDPNNALEVAQVGQRAREWVLSNATPDHYRSRLLEVALHGRVADRGAGGDRAD